MEKWYKYAVLFVGLALSCIIGTVATLGYFKATVKEAVTEAVDPIKQDVSILKMQMEKLIPDLNSVHTDLTLLTYRISAAERPQSPRFSPYKSKQDEKKDFE